MLEKSLSHVVEAMISLSRIFKATNVIEPYEVKTISYAYPTQKKLQTEEQHQQNQNDEYAIVKNQVLQDAEETAIRIIEQAKEKAKELQQQAKIEIDGWWEKEKQQLLLQEENAKQRGHQLGYENGFQQGLQESKEQQQEIIQQTTRILEEAYTLKEKIIQESEPAIIELSLEIAKKIIIHEIDADPDIAKRITIETLKRTKEFEQITISVDPSYYAYLQSAREELLKVLNGNVELLIFPDSSISDAGVMIKTSQGTLDARIDTQLEELKQTLLEVISRRIS